MDETLSKAFLVLMIGMITVFVILLLVVLSGKILILIINRYFPLPEKEVKSETIVNRNTSSFMLNSIPPKKLAAIVAAVDVVTAGKGKITRIKKF